MQNSISEFINFLDHSPSCYHATENIKQMLLDNGYQQLREHEDWLLEVGGRYFMVRGGTTLIAFRIPVENPTGFMMSAAHVDRPTFKVKGQSDMVGTYTRLATEKYGGMIMSTWLDRPLSVAGRVMVETENGVQSKLINLDRDLMLMPSVAIHMNRQINDGYAWNPAVDTVPLMGSKETAGKYVQLLEEAAGGTCICMSGRRPVSGAWKRSIFPVLRWMIWNLPGAAPVDS